MDDCGDCRELEMHLGLKFPSSMNTYVKRLLICVGVLSLVVGFLAFGPESTDEFFMPHAHCYLFNRPLMLLHGGSDLLIGLSYVAISTTLTWMVFSARRELPFHWMMLAFALFIVACGTTHFFEVWTLQTPHPRYWMSGTVKLLTAVASVVTALLLPPLVPKVRSLLEHARLSAERKSKLETAYAELEELYKKVTHLDQLKTSFFANVSHELRTPLTLISAPLERLMKTQSDTDSLQDLKMMRRNTLLLHKYVNDLLDISKIEAGVLDLHYSPVNLGTMARFMESVFDSSLSDQRVTLIIAAPDDIVAEVDGDKVQRVILNLLSNALNYTPRDGTIALSLQRVDGFAQITVEDSGPGVEPAYRDQIFERFQMGDPQTRKRFGGSGLGLSIVKEFVQCHGGTVEVGASQSLGGAAFTVRLPMEAPPDRKVSTSQWASTHQMYGLRAGSGDDVATPSAAGEHHVRTDREGGVQPLILVVEDNWDMSDFICRVLGEEGCIAKASNGKEALEMIAREQPDLIVTDVMMPEMTGDELVATLRQDKRFEDIPVLVLTARPADENQPSLLMKGAQDYVTKPFLVEELRARVHNLVTAKLTRDTLRREVSSTSDNLNQLAQDLALRARELEQANRAKDHFLAVLSHELRTPLTPALTATRMLETTPDIDPQESRESLALIRRNIELEARLVDDLLDFTGIVKSKLRLHLGVVDLKDTVSHAISMCELQAAAKGLEVTSNLAATSHTIRGDAGRLAQVVWNVLLNAVKFTPTGGKISIISSNPAPDTLRLVIADSGIGIEPETLPHIFEPFRQADDTHRRFGGLGLGLSVAKGLVTAHAGTISAASEGCNQGTTITMDFALTDELVSTGGKEADLPSHFGNPLRILVVEDHLDTRQVLCKLLTRWGHQVASGGSVAEGLEAAGRQSFDLLLSDVSLPDGTGMDLLQQMGDKRPVYAVSLSGHGMPGDFERSRKAGFFQHLVKPVSIDQLKRLLGQFVKSASSADSTTT
ncbi:MAG: histidine kinase,Response regulator receiver domain proteinhistidine kinase, partial [Verrucomicrobiaceae bacterium]|nr:histidine kinase,Response regulator receiver domain proteinhistidine kinase [Verrucomicrobiaceae bacterium]